MEHVHYSSSQGEREPEEQYTRIIQIMLSEYCYGEHWKKLADVVSLVEKEILSFCHFESHTREIK